MDNAKKRNQFYEVWVRLKDSRTAMFGFGILILLIIIIIGADLIVSYKDAIRMNMRERLLTTSVEHFFGTDDMGRDIFARVIHGARISLGISISVVLTGTFFAILFGSIAGYYGGKLDEIIMRIMDIFMAIPGILLCIAIVAALGPNLRNLLIAMVVPSIPAQSRLVRSCILGIKRMEYVEAARAIGAKTPHIIRQHLLLNSMGPILVNATMSLSNVVIGIAGLSFIGLGVQPPTPEWGAMLSNGREFMRTSPHLIIIPGLFIFLATISINLFGDGLRDAMDPKLRT